MVVGGEACPAEVVDRWGARAVWVITGLRPDRDDGGCRVSVRR